jgi:hypothetical protein
MGGQGREVVVHCWMRAFCDSLTTNCCRSFFSASDIWEMSMFPLPRESILCCVYVWLFDIEECSL